MSQSSVSIDDMIWEARVMALRAGRVPKELFLGENEMASLDALIMSQMFFPSGSVPFQSIEGGEYMRMKVRRQSSAGAAVRC
jgi:hypothetical protein